jgi:prephenate dehydrogenase
MSVTTEVSSDPPFSRVGIVGLGLIGGSIALAVRTAWPRVTLVGLDRSAEVSLSAHRGVVHDVTADFSGLADCDLIILATPLPSVVDCMPAIVATGTNAVVTDVGSTKRGIMAAAAAAGLTSFVGGHPMAGSERAGLGQARADIFEGRPWLLVEQAAGADAHQRMERFVNGLGGVPQWIAADVHDRTVAYISHLPQVIAVALMNAAADGVGENGLNAGGRAFSEMTRVASSPADMWEAIFARNDDFVAEALARFVAALPTEADLADPAWVRDAFGRADRARTRTTEAGTKR